MFGHLKKVVRKEANNHVAASCFSVQNLSFVDFFGKYVETIPIAF
jgi:hypothetical protein